MTDDYCCLQHLVRSHYFLFIVRELRLQDVVAVLGRAGPTNLCMMVVMVSPGPELSQSVSPLMGAGAGQGWIGELRSAHSSDEIR